MLQSDSNLNKKFWYSINSETKILNNFCHFSFTPIIDRRQKEHGQDTVNKLDQENSPTGLQTEPTSLRKMHKVPRYRQLRGETLLDFIDHLIEQIIGSEEWRHNDVIV